MKNKEIQEQRMKGYFIQSTKEILKAEGLKSISVRNIAEKAGYSYATLYNYFKDVNDLIFLCVEDFQQECEEFVRNNQVQSKDATENLKSSVTAFAKYFVEYPGIFDLFFIERIGDFGSKQSTIDLIYSSFDAAIMNEWDEFTKQKQIGTSNGNIVKNQLKFTLTGMLLYYLNRRTPEKYQDFIHQIQNHFDYLIQRI